MVIHIMLCSNLDAHRAKRKYQIVLTKADLVTPQDLARRYHLVNEVSIKIMNMYCLLIGGVLGFGSKALQA